jgi:O-antigen/teichoic acid export membrane protein
MTEDPQGIRERAGRLTREVSWVAAGQLGAIALRLVGLKILTSLLAPEAYGELTVLLTFAALGSNVLFNPLHQAMLRFFADAAREGRIDALRRLTVTPLIWAGAGFALAVMIGAAIWLGPLGYRGSVGAFGALIALTIVDTWRTLESNLLNAARRQREFATWGILDALLRAILPIGAIRLLGPTAGGILTAHVAASVVTTLAFRRSFIRGDREGTASHEIATWVEQRRPAYRRFFLPIVPVAALGWIIGAADRPLIAALGGLQAVGIYGAVYGLSSAPFIAVNGIAILTLRPILFAASSAGDARRERRVLAAWLAAQAGVGLLGWAAIVAFKTPLVHLATGSAFWAGASLVPWIAAAYAIQGVQSVFDTRLFAHQRTPRLLVVQGIGAATALALYLVLIPKYGGLGAALATLASMTVSCVASISLSRLPSSRAARPA